MRRVSACLDHLDSTFITFRFRNILHAVDMVETSDYAIILSEIVGQTRNNGVVSIFLRTPKSLLTVLDLIGIAQVINNLLLFLQEDFEIYFLFVGLALHG